MAERNSKAAYPAGDASGVSLKNVVTTVLHVVETGDPKGTAIAGFVSGLVKNSECKGFQFAVLFISAGGPLASRFERMGVQTNVAHWSGSWKDPYGAARFIGAVRSVRPGIVHLHSGGRLSRLLVRLACKSKIAMHFHSLGDESQPSPQPRRTDHTDLVIANSAATARTLLTKSVVVISPGVEIPPPRNRPLSIKPIIIGTLSRLSPVKGVDVLLDAARVLLDRSVDFQFEIAGDGPELIDLQARARRLGLEDRVHFLGWIDDPQERLGKWDIYVQPSRAEGFGLGILEAMAAGLPVVASAVGGIPELVEPGITGFLIPPDNSDRLADSLVTLSTNGELREVMGKAGRKRASTVFAQQATAQKVCTAYHRLLE
jgi:glycosyltransferase involved in cell wall biosynthesis